jgi:hypothetical protein
MWAIGLWRLMKKCIKSEVGGRKERRLEDEKLRRCGPAAFGD